MLCITSDVYYEIAQNVMQSRQSNNRQMSLCRRMTERVESSLILVSFILCDTVMLWSITNRHRTKHTLHDERQEKNLQNAHFS